MYEVGQRVLIRSEHEIKQTLDCGHCAVTGTYWNGEDMTKYCNRMMRIAGIESDYKNEYTYLIRGDHKDEFWCWSQDWIKPAVELPKELFEI